MAIEINGNHIIIRPGATEPPRNRLGSSNNGIASAEAKVITNAGMIWTKTIAFNVAIPVVFEFNPIHIPNQNKAAKLPIVVSMAPSVIIIASKVLDKSAPETKKPLLPTTVVRTDPPDPLATVTTVALVTLDGVAGAGGGGGM